LRQLKHNKIDYKTHFISRSTFFIFRDQGAIIREFYQQQSFVGLTGISGPIHTHFHHKS